MVKYCGVIYFNMVIIIIFISNIFYHLTSTLFIQQDCFSFEQVYQSFPSTVTNKKELEILLLSRLFFLKRQMIDVWN